MNEKVNDLVDTVDLMTSNDYKDRFRAEYYQLKIRYNKLMDMLRKWKAGELNFKPSCPFNTLYQQSTCMRMYLDVLEKRAKIENIELS